jgi:3-hydroxyisobutyrate dehydrogenase-like beta-hydroxyacid dehydrogenase
MHRQAIGILGLGLMGTALAERLLEHGIPVVVWNRTRSKADPLVARGARWSDNPLLECQRVLVSLFDSAAVETVLTPLLVQAPSGRVILDTTTGDPESAADLGSRCAARGIQYLDAPISGSSAQTRKGDVTIFVGGDRTTYESCADLWSILGHRVLHVGTCGSASRMKLITNLVLGLNRAALAEGLAFAEALGVDPAAALEALKNSNAHSRAMDVKGGKMVSRDYTPQARLSQHLKDVRLILDAAAGAGLALPLAEAHRQLMEHAESLGLGEHDNSAILEALRRRRKAES